jgi:predicted extracellular nuclease
LPLSQRYSYVFEGNSEVLDHILLSAELAGGKVRGDDGDRSGDDGHGRRAPYDYDVVHVNSEFADQASDHEPQIVRLDVH